MDIKYYNVWIQSKRRFTRANYRGKEQDSQRPQLFTHQEAVEWLNALRLIYNESEEFVLKALPDYYVRAVDQKRREAHAMRYL